MRWLAVVITVGLVAVGFATNAGAQSSGKSLEATEVGITPTEIHIAVVADVDSPLAPNVFKGSVNGVQAFAKYQNANGGLAGRKVVVDFLDSHLNPNETRNALITACSQDFAMVGTSVVFLNNTDDMTSCKDKSGAATGIPDMPFTALTVTHECSPETFAVSPPQLICSTANDHPQTYQASVGRAFYYEKKFGKDLHGPYIFSADSTAAYNSQFSGGQGQVRAVGIKSDKDYRLSASAIQSQYTQVVQAMKADGSTYAQSANPYTAMIALRKEATLQGVTGVKVWDCFASCYDPKFLSEGGSDVEGQFVALGSLPWNETKANPMLANYVKYMGSTPLDGFSQSAFEAGLLFADNVNAVVKESGNNGLTRKALFAALNADTSFNAAGMQGEINPAKRIASPCYMLTQVKNGKFVRVYPTKPGTFDCNKKNLIQVKLDLSQ